MTATYDGHLIVSARSKKVQPCCETMAEVSWSGILYVGSVAKTPALLLRIADKRSKVVSFCPFCRAQVEVVQ